MGVGTSTITGFVGALGKGPPLNPSLIVYIIEYWTWPQPPKKSRTKKGLRKPKLSWSNKQDRGTLLQQNLLAFTQSVIHVKKKFKVTFLRFVNAPVMCIREAFKKKLPNLGHCPKVGGGVWKITNFFFKI